MVRCPRCNAVINRIVDGYRARNLCLSCHLDDEPLPARPANAGEPSAALTLLDLTPTRRKQSPWSSLAVGVVLLVLGLALAWATAAAGAFNMSSLVVAALGLAGLGQAYDLHIIGKRSVLRHSALKAAIGLGAVIMIVSWVVDLATC